MPIISIDNVNLRGFFARTPTEETNHRFADRSINDTGTTIPTRGGYEVQSLRMTLQNTNNDDLLWCLAGGDTLYTIPGTGRMHRMPVDAQLWSTVTAATHAAMGGAIDMMRTEMPSMDKRSRINFSHQNAVNSYPVFVWHRANLDENFFAGVEGPQPTLLLRNFQAGTPSLQLSQAEPAAILRGNRFFIAKRRLDYLDRWSNATAPIYAYTLEFISASHVSEWTEQAKVQFCEVVNAIRNSLLQYSLDFIDTALQNVVQSHTEYYGQAMNDGICDAARLDTPQPAPAFNWHGVDVINALSMTPVGVQYQETQARGSMIKLAAAKAREEADTCNYQINDLNAEVQQAISQLERLYNEVAQARIALGNKNAELATVNAARARAQAQADTFDLALMPLRTRFLTAIENTQVDPENALNAYFRNMGVVVHRVHMEKDGQRYNLQQISPADLVGGGYKVHTLEFETLRPDKLRAINEAGEVVCQRRVCGPYRVLITYANGAVEFKYRLAHPNGVIASSWRNGLSGVVKIHPHHPEQRLAPFDQLNRWITGACLGELAPTLRNSLQNGNPRLAVTACLTFLQGALATDSWGASFRWFPFAENYSFDWTAAVPEHLVANRANLTCYINQSQGRAILVDDEWALMRVKYNEDWTNRWIPRGGRTAHELVLSVLDEAEDTFDATIWRIQAPTTTPAVEQAEEIAA